MTATLAHISDLAVCAPEQIFSQAEVLEMLDLDTDVKATAIFNRCGVAERDLGLLEATLSSPLQGRTLRNEDLLLEFATRAIDQLGVDPAEIGVVVTASLFSLGGPTLAHRLVEHYSMDPATDKYHIVGVGCASAVPLIRMVSATLSAHPGKKGLIVAADTMSGLLTGALPGDSRAKHIGAAIFGDGCAAAIIEHAANGRGPSVVASKVHQISDTLGAVRMELTDTDSYLHLDRDLPDVAAAGIAPLVDDFLAPLGLERDAIDHWIVHPGGRRILECVGGALELSKEQLGVSYKVLSERGNVGTPSIFYVLNETIVAQRPAPGERALMLTVGPGITVGLMVLAF